VIVARFLFALAFFSIPALPLLLLAVRPFTRSRHTGVRFAARTLAMLLLWLAFDVSLVAVWGAVGYGPAWWALLLGFPALQIPAAWLGYRVAFVDDDRTDRRV
jgi:hypothetical protein